MAKSFEMVHEMGNLATPITACLQLLHKPMVLNLFAERAKSKLTAWLESRTKKLTQVD